MTVLELVILFVLNAEANNYNLEPIRISPVINNQHDFIVNNVNTNAEIVENIIINLQTKIDHTMLKTISKEISMVIGLDTKIHHFRWDLSINQNLGLLKILSITADVDKNNVNLVVKSVTLEQTIPKVYDLIEKCTNTGRRRYGICGPRHSECHIHHIERQLNEHEINLITQNLYSKVPEAKLLLH